MLGRLGGIGMLLAFLTAPWGCGTRAPSGEQVCPNGAAPNLPTGSTMQCTSSDGTPITAAELEDGVPLTCREDNRTEGAFAPSNCDYSLEDLEVTCRMPDGDQVLSPLRIVENGVERYVLQPVLRAQPNSGGITCRVTQYRNPDAEGEEDVSLSFDESTYQFTLYGIRVEDPPTCSEIERPVVTPECTWGLTQGSDQFCTWTIGPAWDCHHQLLTIDTSALGLGLVTDINSAQYPISQPNPRTGEQMPMLFISAQVLPNPPSGPMNIGLSDDYGNALNVELWPPDIFRLAVECPDNQFIVPEGPGHCYLIPGAVPGAQSYHWELVRTHADRDEVVTFRDQSGEGADDYRFAPPAPGAYQARCVVTAFNGDTVIATPHAVPVNEATTTGTTCPASPEPTGWDIPGPEARMDTGADASWHWQVSGIVDGCGNPLELVTEENETQEEALLRIASELLYNPTVDTVTYVDGVLTVDGPILPTAGRSNMLFTFQDSSGRRRDVQLFPPNRTPITLHYPDLFTQAGQTIVFTPETGAIDGASEYRYWVTSPDGTTIYEEPAREEPARRDYFPFEYTPGETGDQVVHFAVTTFTGDVLETTLPIYINRAGSEETRCYNVPTPTVTAEPYPTATIRGDGIVRVWTIQGATDCTLTTCLTPLEAELHTRMTHFLADGATEDWDSTTCTLVIRGSIRSGFSPGEPFPVYFRDSWGHPPVGVNLPLPERIDPLALNLFSSFVSTEADAITAGIPTQCQALVGLSIDPPGATFSYSVTSPDGRPYNSGSLSESGYTFPCAYFTTGGSYRGTLSVQFYDGGTAAIPFSIPVHD